jgi:site-specific recombinase XerD
MNIALFKEKKELFLTFLTVEKNLSEHTYRAYKSDLEQFIGFWQRVITTEKIDLPLRQTLERFLVSLYHKKISKRSIARKLSCLQSFEKFLNQNNIPISLKLARPRIDKKLPLVLSVDELFHILDTVTNEQLPTRTPYRDRAILELLYATGIRCSELVTIRLNDIDMTQKIIRIFGKGKKERLVLFGQKAHERLIAYITKERSIGQQPSESLFLNNRQQPLTTRTIQRIIGMFRPFIQGRAITPHKIRHSFATHLLQQGVDLRVIQELLGHRTLASTELYTHISTQQLAQMCDTLHPLHIMQKKIKK